MFDHPGAIVLFALMLDAVIGDPPAVYRRIPHPVVLGGWLIAACDRWFNREQDSFWRRRLAGVLSLTGLVVLAAAAGFGITAGLAGLPAGFEQVAVAGVGATLLAQRSLYDHVLAVARALDADGESGIRAGRQAVACIVGRDVSTLGRDGIARAAIESAAENFSDGVVAPALWFLAGGLPGLLVYKLVNTADSMIGHRSPRHWAFGWAAARLDDVMNLLPARLAGLLLVLAAAVSGGGSAGRALRALRVMWRDASDHRSPNAGWPEAAMAGALGLALGGPRCYRAELVDGVWLNAGASVDATADEIRQALRLLNWGCLALWVAIAGASGLAVLGGYTNNFL